MTDSQLAFIAMDEERKICGWKLTKSEGNAEALSCLKAIKSRVKESLLYVITDTCCKSKYLYVSVFGNIEVKLDVFHAVQRLTSCIPQKHVHHFHICNKIGLFVRQADDQGEIRQKETAGEIEMEQNLTQMVEDLRLGGT